MLKIRKRLHPLGFLLCLILCQETFHKAEPKLTGKYLDSRKDNETIVNIGKKLLLVFCMFIFYQQTLIQNERQIWVLTSTKFDFMEESCMEDSRFIKIRWRLKETKLFFSVFDRIIPGYTIEHVGIV